MLSKKIISLFPSLSISGFKIMSATKSGDLFEAKLLDCTAGEAILSLIGNGPLLLMPRAAVVTPIVLQAETHIAVYNETVLQTDTESEEASSEKYGMCMLFATFPVTSLFTFQMRHFLITYFTTYVNMNLFGMPLTPRTIILRN